MQLSKQQILDLLDITVRAGAGIMKYFLMDSGDIKVETKSDNSPLTNADIEASNVIVKFLQANYKDEDIGIISEEETEESNLKALNKNTFFLIDPIDGTSGFLKKDSEWTVNIALIDKGKPIFGSIYVPVKDLLYYGSDIDNASFLIENASKYFPVSQKGKDLSDIRKQIFVSQKDKNDNMKILLTKRVNSKSNSDMELLVKEKNIALDKYMYVASSLKFCLIADASSDIYPRSTKIKYWDIAAGHAIVKYAGGIVFDYIKNEEVFYHYDSYDPMATPPFICCSNQILKLFTVDK